AQSRRPCALDRRIRLPAQIPPPRGSDRRGAGTLRGVLLRPAGRVARLDPARRHQDRRRLSAEGQPAARPRMTASSVAGLRCPEDFHGGTMARYSRSAGKDVKRAMSRRKKGKLKSGKGGKGGTVKSR